MWNWGVLAKRFEVTQLFTDFSEVFYSIHKGKRVYTKKFATQQKHENQVLLIRWRCHHFRHYCRSSTKRYINTKSVHNLPRQRNLNVDRFNIRKLFDTKKSNKSRRSPAETITDEDYADDLALLTRIAAQAEYQLHSLK